MDRRQWFIQLFTTVLSIAISVAAARFGIPIPPPNVTIPPLPPPVTVTVHPPATPPTIPPGVVPTAPTPPAPTIPPPPVIISKADPFNATVKLQARGHYCTGTIIGPRRQDGSYWVLSAGHCAGSIGERQTAVLRSGKTLTVTVFTINRQQDWSWFETGPTGDELPYAELSNVAPKVGARVWHAGFGIWTPGRREEGIVETSPDRRANVHIALTVSSGDSGSGIFDVESGKLVAVVSVGSGSNPSEWTEGPTTPTIRTPRQVDRGRLILPECPNGNCPIG